MNYTNRVKILSLAILFILFSSIFSGCNESSKNNGVNFTFLTIDGDEKQLSDFYGKVIVLDFMAVDCEPCFHEMFELKEISENYADDEVAIISIDVWVPRETANYVKSLIDHFKNNYDIALNWTFGIDYPNGSIGSKYTTNGAVPTIYILDQNGNIYYTHEGYEEYSKLASKIDELTN